MNPCDHRPTARPMPRRGHHEMRRGGGACRGRGPAPGCDRVPAGDRSARPVRMARVGGPGAHAVCVRAHADEQRDRRDRAEAPARVDAPRPVISTTIVRTPSLDARGIGPVPSMTLHIAGGNIVRRQYIDANSPADPSRHLEKLLIPSSLGTPLRLGQRARQDSNLRPPAPEAGALSTELRAQAAPDDFGIVALKSLPACLPRT